MATTLIAPKTTGTLFDTKHLVLAGLLILALLVGVYMFESKRADVAQAKADAAATVANAAIKAAQDSAQQNLLTQQANQQTQAALTAANAQLQATVGQLKQANSQLTTALANRQKQDAGLTPSQQSQRWQALVPTAVVTTTANGFAIDPAGALATLQQLEEVPDDREKISNLSDALAKDDQVIVNDGEALTSEKAAHTADLANDAKQLTAAVDENKKTLADFNAYKAKSHKNFFKTVIISLGIGIGIGLHY